MPLPKDFVTEFLPLAGKITVLGQPLQSLSRKELMASVIFLIEEVEDKQSAINQLPTYQSQRLYSRPN